MLKYARVKFDNNFPYIYCTNMENLKRGDLVLADSSNKLGIATFIDYCEPSTKATRWLVGKIDLKKLRHNLKRELEEEGIFIREE